MDFKKSWGFISLLIGMASLLWGGISLGDMLGQHQVVADMGGLLAAGGHEFFDASSAEQIAAQAKQKNTVIFITGACLSFIGFILMRGQWRNL
ncbi:hypothetical protein A3K86_18835 [Photobacterium jeanii]|uniref:Molybdenum cofactor biosynthesis protein n=1 Tax=Photobacterium jeanii TaxID=858640 RepID=A0A178K2S9_9GAMM|nr:hypothetical protein [Photobacterium jeanii]OAN11033.1 hypothetical protein A3K86_18835 [Photobacterium jeanii]PST90546.1 molybdenum cofactor biosynthesis protein [Photobacterium jeanii]